MNKQIQQKLEQIETDLHILRMAMKYEIHDKSSSNKETYQIERVFTEVVQAHDSTQDAVHILSGKPE